MEARQSIAGIEYPVRPMVAVTADQLPTSHPGRWTAEPKLDGFRCIAHRGEHRVALQSRQQRQLTGYFPEIVAALEELDVEVVLDGEVVCWTEGRIDFAALQRRLYPGASRAHQLSVEMPAAYGSAGTAPTSTAWSASPWVPAIRGPSWLPARHLAERAGGAVRRRRHSERKSPLRRWIRRRGLGLRCRSRRIC